MPIYYGDKSVSLYMGSTALVGFLGSLQITGPVVILPPLPTITPVTGSINNSDNNGKIILDLPDLTENETRTYIANSGPNFVIGSGGDLIRGDQSFTAGTFTGKIVQDNGQEHKETDVTITAVDTPIITLTSPPAQTADDSPIVAGVVTWRDHSVSGLIVHISVDNISKPDQTTDANGNFSYKITPPLSNSNHTIDVSVDAPGNPSAATTVVVNAPDVDTKAYLNAVQAAGYTPDALWASQIDTLVKSLKSSGVWATKDRIILMAVPNSKAVIGLKSLTVPTLVSGPVFTADRGYTGDANQARLEIAYNPGDGGNWNLKQDSANISEYALTPGTVSAYHFGTGSGAYKIRARGGTNTTGSISATGGVTSTGSAPVPQMAHMNRVNATQQEIYVDGVLTNTSNTASVAIANSGFAILSVSGSRSDAQIAYVSAGGGMTAAQIAAERAAVKTYLQARGAVT